MVIIYVIHLFHRGKKLIVLFEFQFHIFLFEADEISNEYAN